MNENEKTEIESEAKPRKYGSVYDTTLNEHGYSGISDPALNVPGYVSESTPDEKGA